jgi:putative peptidoglycan binding protein
MWPDEAPPLDTGTSVGEPRPFSVSWDERWQQALVDWMGVENLEERVAAPGWLDPAVLDFLRGRVKGPGSRGG